MVDRTVDRDWHNSGPGSPGPLDLVTMAPFAGTYTPDEAVVISLDNIQQEKLAVETESQAIGNSNKEKAEKVCTALYPITR